MLDSAANNLILVEGAATYERILEAVREDETEEGILYILDFLKIYPEFAQAHNDLAVLYYRTGNSLKALAHHEKALKLDPRNNTYRKNLADFYFVELEWVGEAVHLYSDIVKDNPNDTEALNALGTIHLQLGRKEKARKFFNKTLQIDGANQEALAALQQLPSPPPPVAEQRLQQQTAPSISPIPATALQPPPSPPAPVAPVSVEASAQPIGSPDELYREATALVAKENLLDAINLLKAVVQQAPEHAVAHNDLGVLYQRIGDRQQSRNHHETAAQLQPGNAVFQKNLADLLCYEFGEFEKALQIYFAQLAKNSTDIEVLKAVATVCLMVEKVDDARYFLQQVLTLKPWDQEASDALRTIAATSGSGTP